MRQIFLRLLPVILTGSLLFAASAPASEMKIHYQALQKVLLKQVFSHNGRHYFYGVSETSCRHAFLGNPRVAGAGGRLQVTAHFQGRAGLEVGGECLGTDDAFEVVMTGVPAYRNGVLVLDQVAVETANPLYNDLIRTFFTGAIARALRYPLLAEVQKAAAEASREGPYQVKIDALEVRSIRTEAQGLALAVDFVLDIR